MKTSPQSSASESRVLAVAAMNAAHTAMSIDELEGEETAINLYSNAIELLSPIADNSTNANSLAAAFMNRGQLVHLTRGPCSEAREDFEKATELLVLYLNNSNDWIRKNYCGTLINHANLLIDLGQHADAKQIATQAIEAIERYERTSPTDTQISLQARRAYCDAIGQILPTLSTEEQVDLAHEASNHVDQALALIRSYREVDQPEPFAEISQRLFRFGALLYAYNQPQFLEEFLHEHLATFQDHSGAEFLNESASQAIRIGVDTLITRMSSPRLDPIEHDETVTLAESLKAYHDSLFPSQ